MTFTIPPQGSQAPQGPQEPWEKPSIYSVLVIAIVLGFIGWALHADKLTLTEGLLASVLGVITWVTRGARPAIVNRIGSKPPPPGDAPPPPAMPPPPLPRNIDPPSGPTLIRRASLFAFACVVLPACGAGGKVCGVVDLAEQACVVVRYLDEQGQKREVRLTPDEARSFAAAAAAAKKREVP